MTSWLGEISDPHAGSVVPCRIDQALPRSRWIVPWALVQTGSLTVVTMVVIAVAAATCLGAPMPPRLLVLLAAGGFAAQVRPALARPIAIGVGLLALATLNGVFSVYFVVLVTALALTRKRLLPFATILVVAAMVLPKTAFLRYYQVPGLWNWLNEPSLALALFVSAAWWRARWNGARPGAPEPDVTSFLLLYLFPTHAANPMVLGPKQLSGLPRIEIRQIVSLLGWFALKAVALLVLRRLFPHGLLRDLDQPAFASLSRPGLWGVVVVSYIETYLALAASADIPILIARLYGWPLPNPFRAALLAWNPVELWRRWGIYNRSFLLNVVYFPLGGANQHRYRNVMLTFLASALVLHSGWFGSKYWTVGTGGWRDESLYFILQGAAVCLCLALWQATGKDPRGDREPRVSSQRLAATAATQAYSALVHIVILAQGVDLGFRFRLIGRCLGL